ncbi:MAG: double zinc ribbon domain-containing protein [Candidatus Heimdallarchaeota archaeon]
MSQLINWKLAAVGEEILQPKKCPHCGKLLMKGSSICAHCKRDSRKKLGTRIDSNQKIECPSCKAMNKPGSVLCSSCGINFIDYEMSKPLDFSGIRGARKRRMH